MAIMALFLPADSSLSGVMAAFSLVWLRENLEEGKMIIEYNRSFYEISYPSDYVKYLG